MRFKFVGGIALAALAFAAWWFIRPQPDAPLLEPPQVTRSELLPAPAAAPPHRVITPSVAAAPRQNAPVEPQPADPVPNPEPLNERTLVGTKWERDGFRLEFDADGKLLISGRERAKWRVEGRRIRLYRDTTGEEHWLDIVGDKLAWEGQEIGRAP